MAYVDFKKHSRVRKVAKHIAELYEKSAKEFSESRRIRNGLFSQIKILEDIFEIHLVVNLFRVPYARAREFGSGIHADPKLPKSPNQTAPDNEIWILPVNAKILAFYWDKAPEYIPRLPDGKVALTRVSHPGQEGKHYMERAIESHEDDLDEELFKFFDDVGDSLARVYSYNG